MSKLWPLLLTLLLCTSAAAGEDNEQFCTEAVSEVADSLILKLQLAPGGAIAVLRSEGMAGELLYNRLVERLFADGFSVYLDGEAPAGIDSVLQSTVDRIDLAYRSEGSGLFSRGQIRRVCRLAASARLLGDGGRLVGSVTVPAYEKTDLLDYSAAELARGKNGLFAPELPPSLHQRIIEPALIITITGALVYLFFASR